MKTKNKIKTFFKNEQHRKIFTQTAEQLISEDNKLMAAIYLLSGIFNPDTTKQNCMLTKEISLLPS